METEESILYNVEHLHQLVFEVTDSCNLNCKYCGVSQLYEGYDYRSVYRIPVLILEYIICAM